MAKVIICNCDQCRHNLDHVCTKDGVIRLAPVTVEDEEYLSCKTFENGTDKDINERTELDHPGLLTIVNVTKKKRRFRKLCSTLLRGK